MHECAQNKPPDGDIQQAQPHDGEPHDGTAAEGHFESGVETAHGGVGRAPGSISGGFHTHEAGQAGEEAAGKESERYPGVLYAEPIGQDGEKHSQHRKNNNHYLVLLFQVRHGAFAHILGNLLHGRRALPFLHHLMEEPPGKEKCHHRSGGDKIEKVSHSVIMVSFFSLNANITNISPSCSNPGI